MTDQYTLNGGFYVDDISPVCLFADVNTVSSSITDTSYQFTGHAEGEYYFYARGTNAAYGWGDYSCLENVDIVIGISESPNFEIRSTIPSLSVSPNPFRDRIDIRFQTGNIEMQDVRNNPSASLGTGTQDFTLEIYDVSGRIIRSFNLSSNLLPLASTIFWDGTDQVNRAVPAGVYFIKFDCDDFSRIEKVVKLE